MNLRTPGFLLAAALVGAATLTVVHGDEPLTERVVRSEVQKTFPETADELNRQPADVRLAFLDYAGDDELVLNAHLALLRHPDRAPRILALYGPMEAFREILREFGPAIVPPIDHFLRHEPASLRLRALVSEPPEVAPLPTSETVRTSDAGTLSAEIRGLYAIDFIRAEGHDFLGQFVTDADGQVAWVQSERFATGVKRFFTSGVTNVETRWRRGEEVTAGDYAWAGVDIMVPVALFRLARVGRAATLSARSARAAGGVARSGVTIGRTGRLVAVGGTLAGIGYVAMNPGVLNSIGAGIADALGLPAWLVSGTIWFLLLLPLLILLRIGQRWLLRPACRLITLLITVLAWVRRGLEGAGNRTTGHPAATA